MSLFKLSSALMLVLASASSSWAQIKTIEPTQESGNPEQPTIYQMTVSAAAEPKPALKYHFLVPPVDQIHGNAATLYYKSLGFEGPDQINAVWKLMSDDETDHLLFEAPLDQFPKDKAAEVTAWLQDDQGYKSWLTKAAQCDYCDWEDQIREQGMYTLLPLAQKTRGLAEALALRARWLMAQNKPEEAIEMLRLNYALGEALGHGTTLIHSLIGIAIQGITNEQTSTLISLDHSPNLYWALTDLAVHPVNIRQAMSYESHFWPFTIHELADLDRRALTADEALTVATQLLETQRAWTIRKPKPMDPNVRQAELLGLAVALYPQARSYLLDHGYKAEQIEVMPVLQTVLLMWWKQFELVRDDTFKWLTLSDDEIRLNLARMEEGVRAAETRGEGGVFTEALPAIQATVGAHFRHQRKINLLRTVEALRMYAADHSRWPEKLDDVTQVPVPLDPWTQKPFDYSVKDGVAILEAPRKPKAPWPLETDERFELTLRSADAKPQPTHLQEK